jgi:hypothetical protein
MKKNDETTIYAQMGMAALLPGMKYMLERMQTVVEEMQNLLAHMQDGGETVAERKLARRHVVAGRNGWAGMTAEERKVEMRRRFKVREEKKAAKAAETVKSPASKAHPDHEEWRKKLVKAKKRAWKKKSPEEREKWLSAMRAGRSKAERQRKKAERAAVNSPALLMEKSA